MLNDTEVYTQPVDPELFLWCYGIYHAAAGLSMPMESPASRPIIQDEDKTYSFSDIPVNRGMLAITQELNEIDTSENVKMSLLTRMMHFGGLFGKQELSSFIKEGDSPEEVLVSEALIKACAVAKLTIKYDRISYEISDVAKIAQQFMDEDEIA